MTLNAFKSGVMPIMPIKNKEVQTVDPKQMPQRLAVALAQ